jgi:putative redox protein
LHLIYHIKGERVERDKVIKAVQLSQDKYCGVSAMYRRIMEISWEVVINGEKVV